ncbi:MAG: TetR/AcrR family transcriptional regulator [Cyclobacteriaceae bacterium]|nr:TetR/AcrR family transcriptional regulator [Cyclobacteriaceae bacterium]
MGKADRTRQFIVEKTAPIFNKKGFEATSLSDLTKATGLTKGAIYGNFSDKEEIRKEAFNYAMEKVRGLVSEHMMGASTYKEQLIAVVNFYASYVLTPPIPGGCPLLNTAIEADDHDIGMRKRVALELNSTVNFIKSLLDKGVMAGEFKSDIDSKSLAYLFFCSVEGALMFSRAERSSKSMDAVVNHCEKILNQISK